MLDRFQGWQVVANHLRAVADQGGTDRLPLNRGQQASLRGLAERLPRNGVVVADEVGMGKTRIAVTLARSVIAAGGRVAIVVPPGLGFQWQEELQAGNVVVAPVLRGILPFLEGWAAGESPWFERSAVLVSHRLFNWRFGAGSQPWRWGLLPALRAAWARVLKNQDPARGATDMHDDRMRLAKRAGATIAAAMSTLQDSHPLRAAASRLVTETQPRDVKQASNYGKHGSMRGWMETAVGMGLGAFDLVIIDEAHKSRGEESGLSRVLEGGIQRTPIARRLALTATPVELDAGQWRQTLERVGVTQSIDRAEDGDIFERYERACRRIRDLPTSIEAQKDYRDVATAFQEALTPYLLRRDKLDVECVRQFSEYSGMPPHAYRQHSDIVVETTALSDAWRKAICAAEALSMVTRQSDDALSKRLRLTMGNGHGIAALLDHIKQDVQLDKRQIEADEGAVMPGLAGQDIKRQQRAEWWKRTIAAAIPDDGGSLFDHPAILAAVDEIECATHRGEKVLVFGRYTLPLKALVLLLNARAMWRALTSDTPWPQAKVHEDEWPAIQAAHSQMSIERPLDRASLDQTLAEQYRRLEAQRRRDRGSLLTRLSSAVTDDRARKVLGHLAQASEGADDKQAPGLTILSRALFDLTDGSANASGEQLAFAFMELIDAASDQDDGNDTDEWLTDEGAAQLWTVVRERLEREYNRTEGSFARLMYGETPHDTRRLLQLAFNRQHNHPQVLVSQSVVGREGLNLHLACRTVMLLHPEWNPGVVEQQIGRVDRVGSKWERDLADACAAGVAPDKLPRIVIRPVIFRGTYDERNWEILQQRWDDLRAQLHGVVISPSLAEHATLSQETVDSINGWAPDFRPLLRPASDVIVDVDSDIEERESELSKP